MLSIIIAPQADPYVMKNESAPSGYSGFCVDLLNHIAEARNFTWEIHIQDTVGKQQPNDSWNGVMGALISRVSVDSDGIQ